MYQVSVDEVQCTWTWTCTDFYFICYELSHARRCRFGCHQHIVVGKMFVSFILWQLNNEKENMLQQLRSRFSVILLLPVHVFSLIANWHFGDDRTAAVPAANKFKKVIGNFLCEQLFLPRGIDWWKSAISRSRWDLYRSRHKASNK